MSRILFSSPPQVNFEMAARTLTTMQPPMIAQLVKAQLPASSLAAATLSATARHAGDSYEGPEELKTQLARIDIDTFRTNPFIIDQPDLVAIADLIPDWQGIHAALAAFSGIDDTSSLVQISSALTNVSNMDQVLLSRQAEERGKTP